jgi:ATP-dependent RNA helicase RhlE
MNFTDLGLSSRTATALETLGFTEPTEIQEKTIPVILAGRDLMASAETGSGKTAAYALPIIQAIKGSSERKPRVLILVPTRELALQVESQFDRFSNNSGMRSVTIYGGTGYEKQTRLLRRGVDVVVATPGRLSDHIDRRNADLSMVKVLVLDEADRMLDMGFTPQVRKIVSEISKQRQTLMFSATINKAVERTASEFLENPVSVFVNTDRVEPGAIDQRIYHVTEADKAELLVKLIKDEPEMNSVLVFARTRHKAAKIRKKLCASNVLAEEIHGDISQSQREKTLARYRDGMFSVLVATDIAARGLDIASISHVVNYDLPASPADYVHRIGRTGRAGRKGVALSFVCADQHRLVRDIEKVTGHELDPNMSRKRDSEPGRFNENAGRTPRPHGRRSQSMRRFRSASEA